MHGYLMRNRFINHVSRSRNRPCAALLWGLASFVALQLGMALVIQLWLPELRDPCYFYKAAKLRRRLAQAGPRPQTIVMLGSSRTSCGFAGSIAEKELARGLQCPVVLYNFGQRGAGPLLELLTLKRLLLQRVRPDLLLVEVLPALLQGERPPELNMLPTDRLQCKELALLGRYGAPEAEMRRRWWLEELTPWSAHRFCILTRLDPAVLPSQLRQDWFRTPDVSGWTERSLKIVSPDLRRRGEAQARHDYYALLNCCQQGRAADALRDLLGLCRQEGIPVALVWMPEGSLFRSWCPPATEARVRAFLDELGQEYGTPFIDARQWVADEDFSDSHHLLSSGAKVFTTRLCREVLPPLLRRTGPSPEKPGGLAAAQMP